MEAFDRLLDIMGPHLHRGDTSMQMAIITLRWTSAQDKCNYFFLLYFKLLLCWLYLLILFLLAYVLYKVCFLLLFQISCSWVESHIVAPLNGIGGVHATWSDSTCSLLWCLVQPWVPHYQSPLSWYWQQTAVVGQQKHNKGAVVGVLYSVAVWL